MKEHRRYWRCSEPDCGFSVRRDGSVATQLVDEHRRAHGIPKVNDRFAGHPWPSYDAGRVIQLHHLIGVEQGRLGQNDQQKLKVWRDELNAIRSTPDTETTYKGEKSDDVIAGVIEEVQGDHDEDGFHLHITTDDDVLDLRVTNVEVARSLMRETSRLRSWIEEHDRQRAAYDRATPEERAAVLRQEVYDGVTGSASPEDEGVRDEMDAQFDRLADHADHSRKAERENRA